MPDKTSQIALRRELEHRLAIENGSLMTGQALRRELGFNSRSAFERARVAGRVGVKIFTLLGRRGKFALTRDVANFLAKSRLADDRSNPDLSHEDQQA